MTSSILARSSGSAAAPTSRWLASRAIQIATEISSSPITTEAAESHSAWPLNWCRPMPAAAIAMPARAALSSKNTILTFGSRLWRA